MSKHTPGPWVPQVDNGRQVVTTDGEWICQLWTKYEDDMVNAQNNVLLIAAAPDLLAACEKYLAAEQQLVPGGGIPYAAMIEASQAAKDAIAKAKGHE